MTPSPASRPPIVAVVGHIDHGKSTLLDYIRKTSVVEKEAGGITQHLSAYEVSHTSKDTGEARSITFLDTPGHAAFQKMRARGLEDADVAILVVSAEEGAKPQTLEAVRLIQETKRPYIVAINKIDKPAANVERTKASLIENEIYLEGMGGDVPYVAISAKRGDGIPELLDLILLAADIAELTTNPSLPGTGTVIEAHVDARKGTCATLIVREGKIESGQYVVAGEALAPTRIMENFLGKKIKEVSAGSPVQIIGFSVLPETGIPFSLVSSKKEAEVLVAAARVARLHATTPVMRSSADEEEGQKPYLPLFIKTDVAGTIDAIEHEIAKLPQEKMDIRIVGRGVGAVSEGDVKMAAGGSGDSIILGFNVQVEPVAKELAERLGIRIHVFDVIYHLTEEISKIVTERTPKKEEDEERASCKVLKLFGESKAGIVLGGRVEEGTLSLGDQIKIVRRDIEVGRGTIESLQMGKTASKKVEVGQEFGALVKTKGSVAPGDYI